jgi:hypothetical protein
VTLIIRDALVNPPTWFASFRDLTLFCTIMLRLDIVIESEEVDTYHRWIRRRGGMDFIRDFVRPGSEEGLRLDTVRAFPRTIVTDRIVPENAQALIARIEARAPARDPWWRPEGR